MTGIGILMGRKTPLVGPFLEVCEITSSVHSKAQTLIKSESNI